MFTTIRTLVLAVVLSSTGVISFDIGANDNMVVYWGQNSYGAAGGAASGYQKSISAYCQDDSIDVLPIAFLDVFFDTGDLPSLNLANICNNVDNTLFPGSDLPDCSFMAADIQACQAAGKIVTLSLGGATGSDSFTSADQASAFGTLIYDLFLGGSSDTRPFGDAVLDGIDLDIEGGGTEYFASFVSTIQSAAKAAGETVYFSAAPQCPYPDAYMQTVLNAASFDMVYVQFYNNYCSVAEYSNPSDWDYSDWDTWASTVSLNPDVKVYIGAPASTTAAGSGYVDAATLGAIGQATQSYGSFGGVMLWDASQAVANGNYQAAVKDLLAATARTKPVSSAKISATKTASATSASKSVSASVATKSTGSRLLRL